MSFQIATTPDPDSDMDFSSVLVVVSDLVDGRIRPGTLGSQPAGDAGPTGPVRPVPVRRHWPRTGILPRRRRSPVRLLASPRPDGGRSTDPQSCASGTPVRTRQCCN